MCAATAVSAAALVIEYVGRNQLANICPHLFGDLVSYLPSSFVLLATLMVYGPHPLWIIMERHEGDAGSAAGIRLGLMLLLPLWLTYLHPIQ